ncbi:arylesterase [Allosediminivita pacifica]|uniref:Acyl-CoA thioesterase-1 n=1 Tax=Allosediminivita pacifica TaxID=1267769 RepID=A0A2T6B3X4_9RHOB|nr:arylesterase [Allosediminivita pacifica]PTX50779.1 acyl-CoA thioesterase-1 [Allosediminivita pacifica]GGB01083.1 arylesterase [Allosediminivita pacifica]
MKHRKTYGALRRGSKIALLTLGLWAAPALAEQVDILALGDSLTQGYGLPEQDGFVRRLETWLRERNHDVAIVNAGVSGDTTAGGLSRVEWSLTPEIDAMILALGANDMLRGLDPEVARGNLEGILEVAQLQNTPVLLIGIEAPGNYGADYKQAFDAIYPDLAEEYETLYLDSFFAGLRENGALPDDLSQFVQADGLHPNPTGVERIVEGVGPKVEELIDKLDH